MPEPARILNGADELRVATGTTLGTSDWVTITQQRIDQFAEATGDHQWIHTDPQRAADGPYGTTMAHGYLTLSLTNMLLPQVVEVRGFSAGVNYGVDKVRFPAAVPSGSQVRATVDLIDCSDVTGGVQTVMRITVECDATDRPVCVVEAVSRWLL